MYAHDTTAHNVVIDVLTVPEAAEHRHSIRSYEPTLISHDDLEAILATVRLAPSAYNVQPWRFVAVEDPDVKRELSKAAYGQQQIISAPCVLVLYTDMCDVLHHLDEIVHPGLSPEQAQQTKELLQSSYGTMPEPARELWGAGQGYIALGFLLLAAEAYGYQTSAMLGFDPEAVKKLLDIPAHCQIPALIAIGHGTDSGFPHHRHHLDRILRYV